MKKEYIIKLIFNRQPNVALHAAVFALLSMVLMMMDYHQWYAAPVRAVLHTVSDPISHIVNYPSKLYYDFQSTLSSQEALLDENRTLNARVIALNFQLQRLRSLEQENKQLRALLDSSMDLPDQVSVGRIISVATNPSVRQVTVNIGKEQSAYLGQAVVDAHGVFGQITELSAHFSRVQLITDTTISVPVVDVRSGFRAITEGNMGATLNLVDVPNTADIKIGDVFVTSGLGGVYPEGYPVGTVATLYPVSGEAFLHIKLAPTALLSQSRLLLFIWPHKHQGEASVA